MYMRRTAIVRLLNQQKYPLLKQNSSDIVLGVTDIDNAVGLTNYPSVCTSQVPDVMTTSQGHSKTSTLTVGPQGTVLLQDFTFINEMTHFDRERVPERVNCARQGSR